MMKSDLEALETMLKKASEAEKLAFSPNLNSSQTARLKWLVKYLKLESKQACLRRDIPGVNTPYRQAINGLHARFSSLNADTLPNLNVSHTIVLVREELEIAIKKIGELPHR